MGSRMMHLAISNKIKDLIDIKDTNRFLIGSILPDRAPTKDNIKTNSHYKIILNRGNRKTYDLNKFRTEFKKEILSDDLYLGYYLHLVQDLIYRKFVYDDYEWNPRIPGNVEKLHIDYALLNSYLIEKYKVVNNLTIPNNFEDELINKIHFFEGKDLLEYLKFDFKPYNKGETFFFTESMTDEYIERSVEICKEEIENLKGDKPLLEVLTYSWN